VEFDHGCGRLMELMDSGVSCSQSNLKRPTPQFSRKVVSSERKILLEGDFERDPSKFWGLLRSLSFRQNSGITISLCEPLFAQMGILMRKIMDQRGKSDFLDSFQTSARTKLE